MGLLIAGSGMDRSSIADSDHNGMHAGLAGAIHFEPKPGDFALLVQMASRTTQRHVLYKIVMALGRLADTGNLQRNELEPVETILAAASQHADAPLRKRIRKTRALIKYTFEGNDE